MVSRQASSGGRGRRRLEWFGNTGL
jgi:hypothetical protein